MCNIVLITRIHFILDFLIIIVILIVEVGLTAPKLKENSNQTFGRMF